MANAFRQGYLAREKQKGNQLMKVGRIYFRNSEGFKLGITASAEDKRTSESTCF